MENNQSAKNRDSEKDAEQALLLLKKLIGDEKKKNKESEEENSDLTGIEVEQLTQDDARYYAEVLDFLRTAKRTVKSRDRADELTAAIKSERDSLPTDGPRHHFMKYLLLLLNPWSMKYYR